jgi:hypothetical protein
LRIASYEVKILFFKYFLLQTVLNLEKDFEEAESRSLQKDTTIAQLEEENLRQQQQLQEMTEKALEQEDTINAKEKVIIQVSVY